jgi:hypothetical protein
MSDRQESLAEGLEHGATKRRYVKPACVRIRLATDEVLAAGCKNESSAGPQEATCDGGMSTACYEMGS